MGGQISKFRKLHHLVLCDYRSQSRLVQSDEFTEVWNEASDEVRDSMIEFIDKADPDKLRTLMTYILAGSGLDRRSYVSLRRLASVKGIKYYAKMSKAELISALSVESVLDSRIN